MGCSLGRSRATKQAAQLPTALAGAEVNDSSQGAVLGGLRVSAETSVVWVLLGGGQGALEEGVPVHFNPLQVQRPLIAGRYRSDSKTAQTLTRVRSSCRYHLWYYYTTSFRQSDFDGKL